MYAFVEASSPWLDEHIERFIRHHAPDAICVGDLADIPSSAENVFQWCCGQQLNKNFALLNRAGGLINAYPNSDALARKDHLGVVVDFWTAKRPDSILKHHVPQTVRLTLDYAEYVDEALMAADDLTLLYSLEENENLEPRDRQYWILKPALVDCGAGIRIFSTMEELASHLELAEYEESDEESEEEESEGSTEESEVDDPIELEKGYDNSFSPSLSQPGLNALDVLVTTGSGVAKPKVEAAIREKKPTYVFKEGGRIPSSEMRAFVAQKYLASIATIENRKWHVRAYVLSVGRLKVHVFRDMLLLLAGEDYQGPWENPSLKSSLTNTALQDADVVEARQSMRAFWDMPEDLFPEKGWKEGLFQQICDISSELFRAAAHTMADKFTTLDRCFELFAVDFLVDDKGSAWLLEVNETPAFYQQGVAGPMSLRLMESAICVVMEHMGLAHIGEARNAAVRRRMVDVLDESDKLPKSNIVEVLADR